MSFNLIFICPTIMSEDDKVHNSVVFNIFCIGGLLITVDDVHIVCHYAQISAIAPLPPVI